MYLFYLILRVCMMHLQDFSLSVSQQAYTLDLSFSKNNSYNILPIFLGSTFWLKLKHHHLWKQARGSTFGQLAISDLLNMAYFIKLRQDQAQTVSKDYEVFDIHNHAGLNSKGQLTLCTYSLEYTVTSCVLDLDPQSTRNLPLPGKHPIHIVDKRRITKRPRVVEHQDNHLHAFTQSWLLWWKAATVWIMGQHPCVRK